MNKLYSVHDHWTDINKKNDVDIESIDGVITGIKVNGEDYGGGVTWNTVFEGNVTTVSEGAFASGDIVGLESLDGDSVRVTFNGVEYTLPKHELGYGELGDGNIPDFTNYPLFIENTETPCSLYTQTAGTYSLKIEEPQSGGGGSSDLSTATVTIIWDPSLGEDLLRWENCPVIIFDLVTGVMYTEISPAVITVPLYKGKCYWEKGTQGLTLSGNIEEYDDGAGMLITGDCTITILNIS